MFYDQGASGDTAAEVWQAWADKLRSGFQISDERLGGNSYHLRLVPWVRVATGIESPAVLLKRHC